MHEPTTAQVDRAAHELASQEFYNPTWCKPGKGSVAYHGALYRRRARLILEAALASPRQQETGETNG
jgi:hypothetical protein